MVNTTIIYPAGRSLRAHACLLFVRAIHRGAHTSRFTMRALLIETLIAMTLSCAATLAVGAAVTEREVSIKTANGVLWGTLAAAGETPASPAAIIIPGSGPTNRDGNAAGIHPDTLKLLA